VRGQAGIFGSGILGSGESPVKRVSLNKSDFPEISITIREANMTELTYLVTKNNAQFREQRLNKLQDAVSGIPPAKQQ
jgi:hypothetical protein